MTIVIKPVSVVDFATPMTDEEKEEFANFYVIITRICVDDQNAVGADSPGILAIPIKRTHTDADIFRIKGRIVGIDKAYRIGKVL